MFIWLEFAAFGRGLKVKPSRASGFRFFLSATVLFGPKIYFREKASVFISIHVTSREKRPITKVELVIPLSLAWRSGVGGCL